eukprot:TRINITY_DN17455_c0_g1_i1.p1 TRINITY_DN17455_c0_g1~~TRINITY_DN17455_c0_g1_i1.p1  ORF type:complete len:465 (-),score=116.88 TRINITY_DN17455_c0_g1_i1:347-1741(-)
MIQAKENVGSFSVTPTKQRRKGLSVRTPNASSSISSIGSISPRVSLKHLPVSFHDHETSSKTPTKRIIVAVRTPLWKEKAKKTKTPHRAMAQWLAGERSALEAFRRSRMEHLTEESRAVKFKTWESSHPQHSLHSHESGEKESSSIASEMMNLVAKPYELPRKTSHDDSLLLLSPMIRRLRARTGIPIMFDHELDKPGWNGVRWYRTQSILKWIERWKHGVGMTRKSLLPSESTPSTTVKRIRAVDSMQSPSSLMMMCHSSFKYCSPPRSLKRFTSSTASSHLCTRRMGRMGASPPLLRTLPGKRAEPVMCLEQFSGDDVDTATKMFEMEYAGSLSQQIEKEREMERVVKEVEQSMQAFGIDFEDMPATRVDSKGKWFIENKFSIEKTGEEYEPTQDHHETKCEPIRMTVYEEPTQGKTWEKKVVDGKKTKAKKIKSRSQESERITKKENGDKEKEKEKGCSLM